jgi:hypothetical protein
LTLDVASLTLAKPIPAATDPMPGSLSANNSSQLFSLPITFSALSLQAGPAAFDQLQVELDLGDPELQIVDLQYFANTSHSPRTEQIHFTFARTRGGSAAIAKIAATKQASLQGNHSLQLTLQAPTHWRGQRFHVQLAASLSSRSLATLNGNHSLVAQDAFPLVAVHQQDVAMQQRALQFLQAHQSLRQAAATHARAISRAAAPTVIHQVSNRLDLTQPRIPTDWLQRTILSTVDPYHDPELKRLPVDVRVAILDYQEQQRVLDSLLH